MFVLGTVNDVGVVFSSTAFRKKNPRNAVALVEYTARFLHLYPEYVDIFRHSSVSEVRASCTALHREKPRKTWYDRSMRRRILPLVALTAATHWIP